MAEVRTIVDELLSEVSNINNDYFVGRASEDNLEGVEVSDLNLQLCDHCQDNIEENKGGSETMDKEKLEAVVDEVVTETAVAEETTEEVAVEEVQVEEVATKVTEEVEVEVVDYQAKATDLETKVAQLTQELQTKATAYETLEAELTALKNKVEASEKETLVNSRMSELTELGIEFSEARKAKELDKISAMDNESFADYKEFLSELSGKKVEVAEATEEVVEEETVEEEIEVEVEVDKAEASALNIETPQPKVIKPFGHLSE
jgi:chromosome segregation ATPase